MSTGSNPRLILPAPGPPPEPIQYTYEPPRKRPKHSWGSCENCRSQKRRCDQKRPHCTVCVKKNLECRYSDDRKAEAQQQSQEQSVLIQRLKDEPEESALRILWRLRAGDTEAAASVANDGNMSGQYRPSTIRTARAVSPPTVSGLEFELRVRHQAVYPSMGPIDISKSSLDYLTAPLSGEGMSPALNPMQGSPYCDERLENLDISYWTQVPITNETAARVISSYLQTEHPVWGYFDAGLFVGDLVDKKQRFCSAFLVNAMLNYACQCYGSVDHEIHALVPFFIHDTELLWRAERSCDSAINVAAILIFSLGWRANDEATDTVVELLQDGYRMAERLKLFGVTHNTDHDAEFQHFTDEWKQASAHVAWGAYNWLTLNSFYATATWVISFPPRFPIPGSVAIDAFGVHWPLHPLPKYMGKIFQALCGFWTIMQEVAAVYHRQSNEFKRRIPLAFAEGKYQKLIHWANGLDGDFSPHQRVIFQMILHNAVMDIFQPWINNEETLRLHSFSSHDGSIHSVIRASVNQLKGLLVESRIQHMAGLMISNTSGGAVIRVSNMMLQDAGRLAAGALSTAANPNDDADDEDKVGGLKKQSEKNWRFFFLLCLAISRDMIPAFLTYRQLSRGLLAMGLQSGAISYAEARALDQDLPPLKTNYSGASKSADYLVDFLQVGATAPEDLEAGSLAKTFDELMTFEDYTINDDLEC